MLSVGFCGAIAPAVGAASCPATRVHHMPLPHMQGYSCTCEQPTLLSNRKRYSRCSQKDTCELPIHFCTLCSRCKEGQFIYSVAEGCEEESPLPLQAATSPSHLFLPTTISIISIHLRQGAEQEEDRRCNLILQVSWEPLTRERQIQGSEWNK